LRKNQKKIIVFFLMVLLLFSFQVSAQNRSAEDEAYVNLLKNSYFSGIKHKALTIGEVLKGLETSINQNENLGGSYSFNINEAKNVGRGQGKYVQMVLEVNQTAISIHFWLDKSKNYVEYLGGEMNDNGNAINDQNQVMRFINMAYNTALEVQ